MTRISRAVFHDKRDQNKFVVLEGGNRATQMLMMMKRIKQVQRQIQRGRTIKTNKTNWEKSSRATVRIRLECVRL